MCGEPLRLSTCVLTVDVVDLEYVLQPYGWSVARRSVRPQTDTALPPKTATKAPQTCEHCVDTAAVNSDRGSNGSRDLRQRIDSAWLLHISRDMHAPTL